MQGLLAFRQSIGAWLFRAGGRCPGEHRRCPRHRSAAAALTEGGHHGRMYGLTGSEALTHSEMASQLSGALGTPISFVDAPEQAMRERSAGSVSPSGRPTV